MAKQLVYKPRRAGFREILNSQQALNLCRQKADKIKTTAQQNAQDPNAIYEMKSGTRTTKRARVFVKTANYDAMRDNAKNNTLEKSLSSGR
jgi:hypothetical protein